MVKYGIYIFLHIMFINYHVNEKYHPTYLSAYFLCNIFSPPLHIARWAHMHRFLSICPSVTLLKIHISESTKIHVNKWLWYYYCDR